MHDRPPELDPSEPDPPEPGGLEPGGLEPGGLEPGGLVASQRDSADRPGAVRWPWMAGLGALAALAVSGVVWLLASLPHPAPQRALPFPPAPSPTASRLSTPDNPVPTVSTWPTVSAAGPASTSAVPTLQIDTISAVLTGQPSPPPTHHPVPPWTLPQPPPAGQGRVPGVVGLRQDTAVALLRFAGYRVTAVPVAGTKPRDAHRVIAQFPPGGTVAPKGSLVTIYVGAGS
jgi:PASTA domain